MHVSSTHILSVSETGPVYLHHGCWMVALWFLNGDALTTSTISVTCGGAFKRFQTAPAKVSLAAVLLFQTGPFQTGPLEQEDQVFFHAGVVVAPVAGEKVGLKLSWYGTGLTGLGDWGISGRI